MIAQFVFWGLIIALAIGMIVALPVITIDANAVIASSAFAYIRAALYFIPAGTCATILIVILGLWIVRVVVTIVKTIWDLLPVK